MPRNVKGKKPGINGRWYLRSQLTWAVQQPAVKARRTVMPPSAVATAGQKSNEQAEYASRLSCRPESTTAASVGRPCWSSAPTSAANSKTALQFNVALASQGEGVGRQRFAASAAQPSHNARGIVNDHAHRNRLAVPPAVLPAGPAGGPAGSARAAATVICRSISLTTAPRWRPARVTFLASDCGKHDVPSKTPTVATPAHLAALRRMAVWDR